MAMFILLTDIEAANVRGPSISDPTAALNPIERQGGVFILNVLVLADPAHESHRDFLGSLPQMDSTDPAFPAPLDVED